MHIDKSTPLVKDQSQLLLHEKRLSVHEKQSKLNDIAPLYLEEDKALLTRDVALVEKNSIYSQIQAAFDRGDNQYLEWVLEQINQGQIVLPVDFIESVVVSALNASDIKKLEWCMQIKAFEQITLDGRTVLTYATEHSQKEMIQFLLESGYDVNEIDYGDHRQSALIYAVARGEIHLVKLLLENGARIDFIRGRESSMKTPLMCAVESNNIPMVQLLLEHGANMNERGGIDGKMPLMCALELGNQAIIDCLWEAHAADSSQQYLSIKDLNDRDIMYYAIKGGCVDMMQQLMNSSPDFWDLDLLIGEKTALHHAIEFGRLNVVQFLLDQGVDINIKDCQNRTPLMYALELGNQSIIDFLIDKGSDCSNPDSILLLRAIAAEDVGMLRKILNVDHFNPNQPGFDGECPLVAAIQKGNYEILQLITRHLLTDFNIIHDKEFDDHLKPLFTNLNIFHLLHQDGFLLPSEKDFRSMSYLMQMAAFFHNPPLDMRNPSRFANWNTSVLKYFFDIRSDGVEIMGKGGVANPDHVWHALEQAWEKIGHQQPDHFQSSIEVLTNTIHTGAVADPYQIATHIVQGASVSFIVYLPRHAMSVSIKDDVLIFTNLEGGISILQEMTGFNAFAGKHIIRLNPEDKKLLTVDFIKGLQNCDQQVLKHLSGMPLLGCIQYKGQKRGNCAGTHPKSIWEDQLMFAHIQHLQADQLETPISAYFYELFNLARDRSEPKVVQHQDLIRSRLKPAYEVFKALTLETRKQTLAAFQADDHAVQFLSQQLAMAHKDQTTDSYELLSTDIKTKIIRNAENTIQRMENNLGFLGD